MFYTRSILGLDDCADLERSIGILRIAADEIRLGSLLVSKLRAFVDYALEDVRRLIAEVNRIAAIGSVAIRFKIHSFEHTNRLALLPARIVVRADKNALARLLDLGAGG